MKGIAKLFPALLLLLTLSCTEKSGSQSSPPLSDAEIEEIVTDMVRNEGFKPRCGDVFSIEVIEWGDTREIANRVFYYAEMEIGLECSTGRITDTGTFSFHVAPSGPRKGDWLFRKVSYGGLDEYQ